jgi:rubrerythrin
MNKKANIEIFNALANRNWDINALNNISIEQARMLLTSLGQLQQEIRASISQSLGNVVANKLNIKIKKAQMENAMTQQIGMQFASPEDLKDIIDEFSNNGQDPTNARFLLTAFPRGRMQDQAAAILDDYFHAEYSRGEKFALIGKLYDMLPSIFKTISEEQKDIAGPNEPEFVSGPKETIMAQKNIDMKNVTAFLKDVELKIASIAQKNANKTGFNLAKTAQHKTVERVIDWQPADDYNPERRRFDPFLRQPINDWHVVERNKGFGFVVDDVWDIDWEAIWRGNIMDKYFRPYRDTETGEWVGGYIEKRFETDKWIPEETNLQLRPGAKHRPFTPNYEGRMEQYRGNEVSTDWTKPEFAKASSRQQFNLSKVSHKKKIKLASKEQVKTFLTELNQKILELALLDEQYEDFNQYQKIYTQKLVESAKHLANTGIFSKAELEQFLAEKGYRGNIIQSLIQLLDSYVAKTSDNPGYDSEYKKAQLQEYKSPFDQDGGHRPPGAGYLEGPKPKSGYEYACPNCGSQVAADATECPNCNHNLADKAISGPVKTMPDAKGKQFNPYGVQSVPQAIAPIMPLAGKKKSDELKEKLEKEVIPKLNELYYSEPIGKVKDMKGIIEFQEPSCDFSDTNEDIIKAFEDLAGD